MVKQLVIFAPCSRSVAQLTSFTFSLPLRQPSIGAELWLVLKGATETLLLPAGPVVHAENDNSIVISNCEHWPQGRELPKPRQNSWLEELVAVLSLLATFG